jgi:Fur family ferric uptake transcriptional regulator
MNSEIIIQSLRSQRQRITPGRRKTIETICKSSSPLSAENLIKAVGMNKTSIYRELEFLMNKGFIQEVDFGDGIKRYEPKGLRHHHHLICLECKRVQDISFKENLEKEEKRIENNSKFKITKHNLEFFGYCQTCV